MDGILWEGKSKIDGEPIAAVLTGSNRASKNSKTGAMQQVWILRRDINPIEAVKHGEDRSICGDCPNRGDQKGKQRACYVSVFRGPNAVYKKMENGGHKKGANTDNRIPVRLGAYGDPGLIPIGVLGKLAENSKGWTGYTHMWKLLPNGYSKYLMASTSSCNESKEAGKRGFRSFMVLPIGSEEPDGMLNCPASEEAGHKTNCSDCLLCNGGKGKDIWIRAHGRGKNFVK